MKKFLSGFMKLFPFALVLSFMLTGCRNAAESNTDAQMDTKDTVSKGSIVWQVDVDGAKEAWQGELNRILREKGADYYVEIREYTNEIQGGAADAAAALKKHGSIADVIAIPATAYEYDADGNRQISHPFREMVENGLLEPLDSYLDAEQSERLSDAVLPDEWEWGKMDGVTYKLSQNVYYYHATAYNKELLDKYGISAESLSVNPFENEEVFLRIAENETVIPYVSSAIEGLNQKWWSGIGDCDLLVCQRDGTLANAMQTEQFRTYLSNIHEFRQNNLIQFIEESSNGSAQNFFAHFYITLPEKADQIYEDIYTYGDQSMDVVVVTDTSAPCCGFEGGDAGNAIASWSEHKEQAFDFLMRLYTDEDIAELINRESSSIKSAGMMENYSNKALTKTENGTPIRQIMEHTYAENDKNLPAGFRFDASTVQEEIDAVESLISYGDFTDSPKEFTTLFFGDFEDLDASLSAAQKRLNDAGMQKIMKEAQKQLSAFKKQQ